MTMSGTYFDSVTTPIPFGGQDTTDPLSFSWYDKDRVVGDKTMAEHLRFAVCYWHSFAWDGSDIFGDGTRNLPWHDPSLDPMKAAELKQDAAFDFFVKLGVPYYCFHDVDMAPAGATFAEETANLNKMVDRAARLQDETGVKLLWGTANLFSHPRFAAGAATNPDPAVFARAAAQVCNALEATHRLGGQNYVLWGGREGYETLLNTDMKREMENLARFFHLVIEHKKKIGFEGTILIEPKPFEPTKHQYDFDSATVHAFLQAFDLVDEVKLNIEVNHATLAGHDFHHEIAYAVDNGILGSIDANAGDERLGWDVDRFPVSVEQMTLGMHELLRGGGFTTGGLNFDSKLRRQSMSSDDLFHAHIGGMDVMSKSFLVANAMIEDNALEGYKAERYAGWNGDLGQKIHDGSLALDSLREQATTSPDPRPISGQQEMLENLVARYIDRAK